MRYELQLADSEAALSGVTPVEVDTASYTPGTALTNQTTYYWRVRAVDDDGYAGLWSETRNFQVDWGDVTGMMYPANGAKTFYTKPPFSWNAVDGAVTYELQLADSEAALSGATPVGVPTASYTPGTDLTYTTHYWRVRAVDAVGQFGEWSNTSTVVVTRIPTGFVLVEGGSFTMGSPSDESGRDPDEGPHENVTISSFIIAKHAVTQSLYQTVTNTNPSQFTGNSNRPVDSVSWYKAVAFCNAMSDRDGLDRVYTIDGRNVTMDRTKNGYRLPTEAEWEFAARGGNASNGYLYSGSNDVNTVGWYGDNSNNTTHAVGLKSDNELGLYDMSGNVGEWCWDWYSFVLDYASQTDPVSPVESGSYRIVRGGSWSFFAKLLRVASRTSTAPGSGDEYVGFRLVLSMR